MALNIDINFRWLTNKEKGADSKKGRAAVPKASDVDEDDDSSSSSSSSSKSNKTAISKQG